MQKCHKSMSFHNINCLHWRYPTKIKCTIIYLELYNNYQLYNNYVQI